MGFAFSIEKLKSSELIIRASVTFTVLLLVYCLSFLSEPLWMMMESNRTLGWIKSEGVLKRLPLRANNWEEIRNEDDLYLGDTLYVPPHVEAEAVLGERRSVILKSNTTFQLLESPTGEIEVEPMDTPAVTFRTFTSQN